MTSLLSRNSLLRRGLFCLLATALPLRASAEITEDPPEAALKKMLEAVKVFLTDADDAVRAGITKQMFEGVSGLLTPRLKQGYKTSYLNKLRQHGHTVYLWKLEFSDGKDEALVKLSVKDGKVSGILIQ
jgi:hypothetical protein